jgi:hypothetical protein
MNRISPKHGYHDIRLGNQPDSRLRTFLETTFPKIAEGARAKFDEFKDLLGAFSTGQMPYHEFAGRVIRRERGENEEGDFRTGDPADWL